MKKVLRGSSTIAAALDDTLYRNSLEYDTIPAPPPIDLLIEASCCAGMLAGGYHSSDCAEITAVETPRELKRPTPFPRKRSDQFRVK